jgi:hypothetical protein
LIETVVSLSYFSSRKAAVHAALTEYAQLLKRCQLLELQGNLDELRASRMDRPA